MKLSARDHLQNAWRVQELAPDFDLLDVWSFELDAAEGDFHEFIRFFIDNEISTNGPISKALVDLRMWVGRLFDWDRPMGGSIVERLTDEDRRRDHAKRVLPDLELPVEVTPVYIFDTEGLFEISNRTIHALLHLAWVEREPGRYACELAVYVKMRGIGSRLYMAAIEPFRRFIIYPTWMKQIPARWIAGQAERARRNAKRSPATNAITPDDAAELNAPRPHAASM